MEIHFVQHGKYSKTYVACKCIYDGGMSQDNIVDLLLALNDCKKFDYQNKYTDPEFIKYIKSYAQIGIEIQIEKSQYTFLNPNAPYPQIYVQETAGSLYLPTAVEGKIYLKGGNVDLMPYLALVPWAWGILDAAHKSALRSRLTAR